MKYTNKSNLPEAVVQAVTKDPYQKGDADFTVTELLRPARQRALQLRHAEEIEEDVSDRLWSLFGQMGHTLLERSGMPNDIAEVRYYGKFNRWTVSAQIDSLSLISMMLTDWKFTTSYKFMASRDVPDDYLWQLNMQKAILEQNGLQVEGLQIGGMLRDWQIRKAKADKKYPQTPICIMPIPILPTPTVEGYIAARAIMHEEAEEKLPLCTKEETWNGRRCESYCSAAPHCQQYLGGMK